MNYLKDFLKKYQLQGQPPEAIQVAREFLEKALGNWREHPIAEIRQAAHAAGIAQRTLERAAARLHVMTGPGQTWALPKPDLAFIQAWYDGYPLPDKFLPLFFTDGQLRLFKPFNSAKKI
jgi:hypothetical protein